MRVRLVLSACALFVASAAFGAEDFEGTFTRTLATEGPVELIVGDSSTATLRVSNGRSGEVVVRGRIHGFPRWGRGKLGERVRALEEDPPIELDGNAVRVGLLPWRIRRHLSFSYDIVVPPRSNVVAYANMIRVEGLDGNLHASGDEVVASAIDGNVTVEGAERGRIEKVNGSVKVSTERGGHVSVSEVDGSARIYLGSATCCAPAFATWLARPGTNAGD